MSREATLSKNLDIGPIPAKPPIEVARQPYVKHTLAHTYAPPIDAVSDVLEHSRKVLNGYVITLPSEELKDDPVAEHVLESTELYIDNIAKADLTEDMDDDALACHADNIMRMAMNLTMLGSFNQSFSLNFLNLVDDEHRSFVNSGDGKPTLALGKAVKLGVSAEELELAKAGADY